MTGSKRRARSSNSVASDFESYGAIVLLRPASAENDEERDDDLRALLGTWHSATIYLLRARGVRKWDGWVLRFWGVEIDEAERQRFDPPGGRYWDFTVQQPPPATTTTYRAVRIEVRKERGRFMMRPPHRDEDLFDLSGPHYAESPVWARVEWPNAGRSQGYWTLAGLPFAGKRPTEKAMTELRSELSVAFDILAAWSLGQGRKPGDGTRWGSDAEALRDIDEEIRKGKHGATAIAVALGVDRSAVYRRVRKATGMRLADYVASVISRNTEGSSVVFERRLRNVPSADRAREVGAA